MITAILITLVISTILNVILLISIIGIQEYNYKILRKNQHNMWDQNQEIRKTVKAIDKKIEDSTIPHFTGKHRSRFMDK